MKSLLKRTAGLSSFAFATEDIFAFAILSVMVTLGLLLYVTPSFGMSLAEFGFPLLALWILYHNRADLLAPSATFPAIYLMWYWAGTIQVVPPNDYTAQFNPMGPHEWLLYVIGFVGMWIGLYTFRGELKTSYALRGLAVKWDDTLLLLLIAGATIAFLAAWVVIVRKDGITILQDDVETLRSTLSEGNHITFQILMVSKLIFPLIYLYAWTASPVAKFRKTLYALGILTVLILTSTGNRAMALDSLLIVFALRHYLRKSYSAWKLALFAVVLALALSVSGYYRAIQHSGPSHAQQLAEMGFPPALQPYTDIYLYIRTPVDTLRNVTKQIPANTPYQLGALLVSPFSQLLPGRHPGTDVYFKVLVGGQLDGFGQPASILGPFYGDFGLIGVFVGMFFTGLTSRILYIKMFQGSIIHLLLYCYFWEMLIVSLYGALFTYILQFLFPVTWIAIVWLIAGKVTSRRQPLANHRISDAPQPSVLAPNL